MTQVLQHDYGKSRVSLLEIRAAIKAVKATKTSAVGCGATSRAKAGKNSVTARSRKGACSCRRPTLGRFSSIVRSMTGIVERLALRQDEVQFVEYVKVAMEWLRDRQQSA